MRIAIHGRPFDPDQVEIIKTIFQNINLKGGVIYVSSSFSKILAEGDLLVDYQGEYKEIAQSSFDALITLGGDGTLLESVCDIGASEVPILGINLGRLGFLASTSIDDAERAIQSLFDSHFELDSRVLLQAKSDRSPFGKINFALNDFTILKSDTSSMIVVKAYLDGEFLNAYWADGLIVSTPTGSTGYSLSCGGPIVLPHSGNFVVNPVSPHNLNVRPLVVSDMSNFKFEILSRRDSIMVSLDSRSFLVESDLKIEIDKANFKVNLVKLPWLSKLDTLRQKLNWGLDARN